LELGRVDFLAGDDVFDKHGFSFGTPSPPPPKELVKKSLSTLKKASKIKAMETMYAK
jgi:hypothetical protein